MPDLELNLTSTCSDSGITCLNSDQRTGRSCPDFKVRYVCTCPGKEFNLYSTFLEFFLVYSESISNVLLLNTDICPETHALTKTAKILQSNLPS